MPLNEYVAVMRQESFLPWINPQRRLDHGAEIGKGKRKGVRPFSHKNAIHVVFRSLRARGKWSLLTHSNQKRVERILEACAKRHHIRIYRFVNVGNHLHLLIKTKAMNYDAARTDFARFLRQFGGEVAFQVTGARKSSPQGGFWEKRVYTRIVSWGREYRRVKDYFTKNFFQSVGLWWGKESWLRPMLLSFAEAGLGPPV